MKTLILLSVLLSGCAYGISGQDEAITYGSTKGPGNDNSNQEDGGSVYDPDMNEGLPEGCHWNNVFGNGVLIASFEVCVDNPGMKFKWLVDPPIDGKK